MGKVTGNWGVDKRTSERVSDHDLHYEVLLWVKSPVIGECGLRGLVVGKDTGNLGVDKRTSERVTGHDLNYEVWVRSLVVGECGLRGLVVG